MKIEYIKYFGYKASWRGFDVIAETRMQAMNECMLKVFMLKIAYNNAILRYN